MLREEPIAMESTDSYADVTSALDGYIDATTTMDGDLEEDSCGDWQDIDRALRSIARRQSGLDAELMRALREAERVQLWRHLGYVSMMEYLERVFGYGPRVAQERIRTARRLEELTELADALERDELPFSAVRELTRVVTRHTQAAWVAAARGKCLREIEDMVSGLEPGDLPGERKRPELMRTRLSYDDIETTTQALERQARHMLNTERGERLDDNAFLAEVFQRALGASSAEQGVGDRAKFQIVHYQCDSCGAAAQLGGGARLPIGDADVDRAECDAEHVSLDAPARPTQDIPKKVRRFVELRDGKRCRIPGCRSTRNLELHHIIHREDGGTHDPLNLIVICGGHHDAHHNGRLWIDGTAADLTVQRFERDAPHRDRVVESTRGGADAEARAGVAPESGAGVGDEPGALVGSSGSYVACEARANVAGEARGREDASVTAEGTEQTRSTVPILPSVALSQAVSRSKSSRYADMELRTNAITALVTMGWHRKLSAAAVDSALATLGSRAELLQVIKVSLQRCHFT